MPGTTASVPTTTPKKPPGAPSPAARAARPAARCRRRSLPVHQGRSPGGDRGRTTRPSPPRLVRRTAWLSSARAVRSTGKPEHALGDDVAVDVRGAAGDRARKRPDVLLAP